ncbi:MAG TPA: UDP-N-acetylmuramate--L-alanine ligase, partial [Spirochaetia bacterium]|nr:UDP-N-acetylmuramate--L-alanine ligase [Spirochaetia bacterium]
MNKKLLPHDNKTFGKTRRIHFIGIGGIGMSGIARIVHNLGFEVSGSDLKTSPVTGELKKQGCRIYIGHRRENIKNADVIVTSS